MRSIQEVGSEILSGNPKDFYVFTGSEYGIKLKYLDILKKFYKGIYQPYDSVDSVLSLMKTKRLIPIQPALYVVRYDENFISSLSSSTQSELSKIHIIVCLYESEKDLKKLEKYLDSYTVSIDPVSPQFLQKYLHLDYPGLPDKLVDLAIECSSDYAQARSICRAMKCIDPERLFLIPADSLKKLFGFQRSTTDKEFQRAFASKNFSACMTYLDCQEDLDNIYYSILQTLLELEKLKSNPYSQSEISKFSKTWAIRDIYYMFENTYNQLKMSRSYSLDKYYSLVYLFSLLCFSEVPSVEELS